MTPFTPEITARWECSHCSVEGDQMYLLISVKTPPRPRSTRSAPVDVAFALDRSGSMSGEPIALVKRAVDMATSLLSDKDRATLVVYDDVTDVVHPLQNATANSRRQLRAALSGVDARGSTNLGDGWLKACLQLADRAPVPGDGKSRVRRTLLLTDGLANVGIVDSSELATHAANLRQRGISTSTLGVGADFDEILLASMAEAGGGNFQYIPSPMDLPAFFERELGRLLATVASGVSLTFSIPQGISLRVLSSYPSTLKGRQLTIELGEMAENEELALLFSVRTPRAKSGATFLVEASIDWINPDGNGRRAESIPVPRLAVVPAGSPLLIEHDASVAEQVALQRAAKDQREAMRLDREGNYAESRRVHARAARLLGAAPQTPEIAQRLSEAIDYSAYSTRESMPETVRKQAVHASYRRGRGQSDAI